MFHINIVLLTVFYIIVIDVIIWAIIPVFLTLTDQPLGCTIQLYFSF